MSTIKTCETCTHYDTNRLEPPCCGCFDRVNYEAAPGIEFAAIVRCKNCAYANEDGTICRYSVGKATRPDRYCSEGEKRESGVESE